MSVWAIPGEQELGEKVFFECLPAEEAVAQGQCDDCQVLIVDPPRRGLDLGVLQLLQGQHAERELSSGNERDAHSVYSSTIIMMYL